MRGESRDDNFEERDSKAKRYAEGRNERSKKDDTR